MVFFLWSNGTLHTFMVVNNHIWIINVILQLLARLPLLSFNFSSFHLSTNSHAAARWAALGLIHLQSNPFHQSSAGSFFWILSLASWNTVNTANEFRSSMPEMLNQDGGITATQTWTGLNWQSHQVFVCLMPAKITILPFIPGKWGGNSGYCQLYSHSRCNGIGHTISKIWCKRSTWDPCRKFRLRYFLSQGMVSCCLWFFFLSNSYGLWNLLLDDTGILTI